MAKERILIVEDERDILKLIEHTVRNAGFDTILADNGRLALDQAARHVPDMILLDIMLPGIDGFEVCKRLKGDPKHKDIPVIMLTARSEEIDRIVGLELGVDDYMVKPFSPRELILRIKAVLRRYEGQRPIEIQWERDGLKVDVERHGVTVDGKDAVLTATEFKLLNELFQAKGKVLTRDALLSRVWGYEYEGYARTVDTHIRRLRQKIEPYDDFIETVRGIGYRFREEVA